ncbi:MAG: DUF3489 domain-containing protein [Verrucomicrobiaceae bacterium]|nr:MAG: DUF3489 domain-containing protein [Verrucomicrobiaceae bacterium]
MRTSPMSTIKVRQTTETAKRPARKATARASNTLPTTQAETLLGLLRRPKGASIAEMADATGWQHHSVRGFLSGELKRKRSLTVLSERVNGVLRYRLAKGE